MEHTKHLNGHQRHELYCRRGLSFESFFQPRNLVTITNYKRFRVIFQNPWEVFVGFSKGTLVSEDTGEQ